MRDVHCPWYPAPINGDRPGVGNCDASGLMWLVVIPEITPLQGLDEIAPARGLQMFLGGACPW